MLSLIGRKIAIYNTASQSEAVKLQLDMENLINCLPQECEILEIQVKGEPYCRIDIPPDLSAYPLLTLEEAAREIEQHGLATQLSAAVVSMDDCQYLLRNAFIEKMGGLPLAVHQRCVSNGRLYHLSGELERLNRVLLESPGRYVEVSYCARRIVPHCWHEFNVQAMAVRLHGHQGLWRISKQIAHPRALV